MTSNKIISFIQLALLTSAVSCGIEPGGGSESAPVEEKKIEYTAIGNYRGYEIINQVIKDRMIHKGAEFELSDYLQKKPHGNDLESFIESTSGNLQVLLGRNTGNGLKSGYQNAQPNSINMLLWYLVVNGLADDVASNCEGETDRFNRDVTESMTKICAWPDPISKDDETLRGIWNLAMQYDAPEDEYLKWKEYILGADVAASKDRREAVLTLFVSAFYNPYFLLQH